MAMSWDRLGLIGVYTANDIKAYEWLTFQTDITMPIYSDYLGACLILENKGRERYTAAEPTGKHYLFLTEWNNCSKTLVSGTFGGARSSYPLPQYNESEIVYRTGNAVIIERGNE
jgi:hypothetical protein